MRSAHCTGTERERLVVVMRVVVAAVGTNIARAAAEFSRTLHLGIAHGNEFARQFPILLLFSFPKSGSPAAAPTFGPRRPMPSCLYVLPLSLRDPLS